MPFETGAGTTRVAIPADPLAVREALCALFDSLTAGPLPQEARDTAQIVLAEALNNIVEHAYAYGPGLIEVTIDLSPQCIAFRISDTGQPMPGGNLPAGQLALPHAEDDLPEGGYGWFLIRALSQDLHYSRDGGRNLLSFRILAQQSTH